MYNVYTHNKKKSEKEKKEKLEEMEGRQEIVRRKHMTDLVESYDKRIKDFVFKLATTPITIQDYKGPASDKFCKETGKNFTFKKFKTDRERLEEINDINKKIPNMNKNIKSPSNRLNNPVGSENDFNSKILTPSQSKKEINILSLSKRDSVITQPSMRFKPRTELERLFESINLNSMGRVDREIVDEQLKNLDINKQIHLGQKQEQPSSFSHVGHRAHMNEEMLESLLDNKEKLNKNKNNKTEMKKGEADTHRSINRMKKQVDNPYAKRVMNDLHVKTHFKGASMVCVNMNGVKSMQHSQSNLNIGKKKNRNIFDHIETENLSKENNNYLFFSKKKILSRDNSDLSSVLYNLDYNPLIKRPHKETDNVEPQVLDYLHQISIPVTLQKRSKEQTSNLKYNFTKTLKAGVAETNRESLLKYNPTAFFDGFKNNSLNFDDNATKNEAMIKIGNELILKTRFDLISKSVLKKCNYLSEKSKNNKGALKAGNGKLMITNGMTINEFTKMLKIPKC